jgi:2-alkyl-3-oxoalkanoate reductase
MRVVLVTGASGAVGGRLVPALSEAGWRTRALVHTRPVPGSDEQVAGDLADEASLGAAATGAAAVLHLAARTHARSERDYLSANTEGTARLLAAARRAGVARFVHVSTRAVSPEGGAYSRSKLAAEALVRDAGIEHVILRLPEVYGAGSREGVDDMLARARRGAAIPVVGRGADRLCPVHVDDLSRPVIAALSTDAARNRTYTLAGECRSAREVALACAEAGGGRSRIVRVPAAAVAAASVAARFLPLPLYPDQLARLRAEKPAASAEAAADLGFAPRPLEAGLRAAVADPAV